MTRGAASDAPEVHGLSLALHACCGPCLLEPYDALAVEVARVAVVYFNPNIHPAEEYARRRDVLLQYAAAHNIEVVELEYDPGQWLERVGAHARTPELRCRACYRLRLEHVADWAADNGFDAIATTLTVSPYQDGAAIAEEGAAAARDAGVRYLDRDFRDRYAAATARSRELEMYRQNYCGCIMSDIEARAGRAERKSARKISRG